MTPGGATGAYAIIVEDPDAPMEKPFVHWMIWNIPGEVDQLAEGVPLGEHLVTPQNAVQGRNDNGSSGYYGPRPPAGTGVHHYRFQIFALDGPLTLKPDADPRALVDAMKGRVLADGELVGTSRRRSSRRGLGPVRRPCAPSRSPLRGRPPPRPLRGGGGERSRSSPPPCSAAKRGGGARCADSE